MIDRRIVCENSLRFLILSIFNQYNQLLYYICTHSNFVDNSKMNDLLPLDKLFWQIAVDDDENAFRTLFFGFFSPLCAFAHRYIDCWETCEDVVQESFLKIWENRKTIKIETSARNFLITSVRNSCIDYLRKQELKSSYQRYKTDINPDLPDGDIYSVSELRVMLSNALDKLPENVRITFEKNRFEGMKYAEIAAEQQISVKTVEAHISKALKHLRTELKDYLHLLILFFHTPDKYI